MEKQTNLLDNKINWLALFLLVLPFLYSNSTVDPVTTPRLLFASTFLALAFLYFYGFKKEIFSLTQPLVRWFFTLGLGYGIWQLLSLIQAPNLQEGITQSLRYFYGLALVFFIVQTIRKAKSKDWQKLGRVLVLVSLVQSFAGLIHFYDLGLAQLPGGAEGSPHGFMTHRNMLGSYSLLLMPWVIWTLLKDAQIWWSRLAAVALILGGLTLIATQSRSPWLAAILSTMIVAALAWRETKKISGQNLLWGFIGLGFIALLLSFSLSRNVELRESLQSRWQSIFQPQLAGTPQIDPAKGSIQSRWYMWEQSLAMTKTAPLFGVGLGNWRIAAPPFRPDRPHLNDFGNHISIRPHNDYLRVVAETGVPSLLLFLGLWGLVLLLAFRLSKGEHRVLVLLIMGGLIAFAIDQSFSFPMERVAHTSLLFLMWGCILGLAEKGQKDRKTLSRLWFIPIVLLLLANSFLTWQKYDYEINLQKANQLRKQGNFTKILASAPAWKSSWVQLGPLDNSIHFYEALAYQATKQAQKGLEVLLEDEKYHPNSARVLNTKGTLYSDLQQFPEAIAAYQEALALAPRYEIALKNLAVAYFNTQDYYKCMEVIYQVDAGNDEFIMNLYREARRRTGLPE